MASPAAPVVNWLTEAQVRRQPASNIPYDGGSGTVRFVSLPQAGYLSHLQLVTKVGATLAAAPTGPDVNAYLQGPIQDARVFVNTEGTLYELDGFMGSIVGAIDTQYNLGDGRVYPFPQSSFTPNPSISAFNDKWLHRIPLGIQLANMPTPIGLYNTALQNLTLQLQARFLPIVTAAGNNPGSGLYVSSGAQPGSYSGAIDINEEYFEPIPQQTAQPPLAFIHRWTQFLVPITVASGPMDIPFTGRQNYLRIVYAVFDGTSGNLALNPNVLTQLQMTYGVQNHPYDETVDQVLGRMRRDYGRLMDSMPPGVYTHDWVTSTHTARDWFDAGKVTNARATLTFNGAHPATGSYVLVATEEVLTLKQQQAA